MSAETFDVKSGPSKEQLENMVKGIDASIEASYKRLCDIELRMERPEQFPRENMRHLPQDKSLEEANILKFLRMRNRLALQCGMAEREMSLEELRANKLRRDS